MINAHSAENSEQVGGKAASLARLVASGFDVPEFFVLTDAAFDQSDQTLNPEAQHAINTALGELGDGPFAVRSSARSEDSADASHAGQFETLLNVLPEKIAGAAKTVRDSGMAEHVAQYRNNQGVTESTLPAVVVQRMVPARAAGVAFSADPVSGQRDVVVVSAVTGLGDALVSGEVDGESWSLTHDGDWQIQPECPEVLTAAEVQQVADLAIRVEAAFGAPQDIEWAFDGGRLYLLQARPITTELRPVANKDDALVVLDNSNIVESYPGLVSPLTYSFAAYSYDRVYRAFVRLLGLRPKLIAKHGDVFANLLTRLDGRVYYNLGNWYRALALLPAFSLNRGYMETMMGVEQPLPTELTDKLAPKPATGVRRLFGYVALLRVGFGLIRESFRLTKTKKDFYFRLNQALSSGQSLEHANLTELAKLYRQLEAKLLDHWDAPLINDFLCMMGFGASRALLKRWAGDAGLEFHNDVMIGQGGIISAEPARQIADMGRMVQVDSALFAALQQGLNDFSEFPEFNRALGEYLDAFGDRCTEELKLESIPLSEDCTPLLAAIRSAAQRPEVKNVQPVEQSWQVLLHGNPFRRFVAKTLTQWAAARVRDRENLRFERTRIFGQARRIFMAMGRELCALGLLNSPRDVLMLTVTEVLGAIEGNGLSRQLKSLVELRQKEFEQDQQRPLPPERIELRGAVAGYQPEVSAPSEIAAGDSRQGTACSKGTVIAKARVVVDPRNESLEPGEILVASNTDPGWIALFAGAAAIVVERGSLLSHSAIVSREMGIPCVVGIRDATQWLSSGDRVEVNGATGLVRKLND